MLSTVMLLGFTAVAAVTDWLWNKIYNWNTYGGIVAGLGLSAAGSAWLWADSAAGQEVHRWLGGPSCGDSVIGLLVCGIVLVVCFAIFKDVSGGDVKLIAMLGALMGLEKGIEAMLWTFVLAACVGLIVLVWRVGPLKASGLTVRLLGSKLRFFGFAPLSDEERKELKPPLFIAPCALAAVVIVRFGLIT
jgi:prepilin peptidase CpaA